MEEIEPLAVHIAMMNYAKRTSPTAVSENDNKDSLVFATKLFKEVKSLKSFIRKLEPDIKQIAGEMRVIFALKKNDSIQQRVVKNRSLSRGENNSPSFTLNLKTQACGSKGCGTCPMLFRLDEDVFVNGMKVNLDRNLNCKSKNVI